MEKSAQKFVNHGCLQKRPLNKIYNYEKSNGLIYKLVLVKNVSINFYMNIFVPCTTEEM